MQLSEVDFKLSASAVVVELPLAESDAWAYVEAQFRTLAGWARALDRPYTEVRYQGQKKPFKIHASMAQESPIDRVFTPGIHADIQFLSAPLLKVLNSFLENPEEKWALVRLSDERQVAMTSSCRDLIRNATVDDALKRKRVQYWDINDLEEFRRLTQQQLEPNNPQSIIQHRFKVVDRTGTDWRWMVSDYRLVEDNGVLYHVSHNRGWESASPGRLAVINA